MNKNNETDIDSIEQINVSVEKFEPNIFRFVVHQARVYNYNDESYKWRYVIPIKKVYNSWIVLPLFTEKDRFDKMDNYFLIQELSKDKNVYIDLSRQDKILIDKKNFEQDPYKTNNRKFINIKKSTIKTIQRLQNIYLYKEFSIVKKQEKELNKFLSNISEKEEYEFIK